MNILFSWCEEQNILNIFKLIKTFLNVIRWIIPIALILMTTLDIVNNVIKPDDKDSKKKLTNRLVAAIIVFLIPTIVNVVMKLVDIGLGSGTGYKYNISECWKNAG